MPFVSKAQERWGHSPSGVRALGGGSAVAEWQSATPANLPEKVKPMSNWLKGAIKHPGALTAAAKQHGVSKLQEAEKEKNSPNPKIRARGALGARLIKRTV